MCKTDGLFEPPENSFGCLLTIRWSVQTCEIAVLSYGIDLVICHLSTLTYLSYNVGVVNQQVTVLQDVIKHVI